MNSDSNTYIIKFLKNLITQLENNTLNDKDKLFLLSSINIINDKNIEKYSHKDLVNNLFLGYYINDIINNTNLC